MPKQHENLPFIVPEELRSEVDDHVLEVHERFTNLGLPILKAYLKQGEESNKQTTLVLNADSGDPEAGVNVLGLPHQQAWKPSMALRSYMYHQINNPDGITIVLPNNSSKNKYYKFTDAERQRLDSGDMTPFYEKQSKQVEKILSDYKKVGKVSLDGYSLGGLTALGIASLGSDKLDVRKVHSVEAPNKETTPKSLRKDFMKSGGFGDQRKAVADTSVPALIKLHNVLPLGIDYARFGIASVTNDANKLLSKAMATPGYANLVEKTLAQYPDAEIFAEHIAGSKLFDPAVVEYIRDPRFKVSFIDEGPGSHKHATGDNIVAHALMMKR